MNAHVRPPQVPQPLPDSPDPVEIAMDQERHDLAADSPARRLLIEQGRLIRSQIASERMGVALKLLTGLAGLIAATLLAALMWDASRTEALVVTPFGVPPELAERGMTGQVVATRLLDGLSTLQAETLSNRPQGAYANDWGDDVQVQIPQTGVSIGELQDFLRGWLGRETNITGEIVRTPIGYSVTARTGTEAGKTFAGPEAELDASIVKAAEAVYASTQPERYAGWLVDKGRRAEAVETYRKLSISGERSRRASALASLSSLTGDPVDKLLRARQAVALDPRSPAPQQALSGALNNLGHAEAELAVDRRTAELLKGRRPPDLAPWAAVFQLRTVEAFTAASLGDHRGAAEIYRAAAEPTPDQPPNACERCSTGALMNAADQYRLAHEPRLAGEMLQRAGAILPQALEQRAAHDRELRLTVAQDWAALLRELEPRYRAALTGAPAATGAPASEDSTAEKARENQRLRQLRPGLAVLLARNGRAAEAQALVAPTPRDCHACLLGRAEASAAARDWRAADRWSAEAARQAPSLPASHLAWGRIKLAQGDFDGAARLFREAQKRGPRWAEAFKLEGDALAGGGDHRGALKRYEAALERAPGWEAAHLAAGRSLAALGREERARAAFARAARLDLSAADRAGSTAPNPSA